MFEFIFMLVFPLAIGGVEYGIGWVWITVRSAWEPGPYGQAWRDRHRRLLRGIDVASWY